MNLSIEYFFNRINVLIRIFLFVISSFFFLMLSSFSNEEISSLKKYTPEFFQLPLYFERNVGQADSTVKYLARKNSGLFLFTPKEILINLPKSSQNAGSLLRMQFIGGNASSIEANEKQEAKTNYFIGNDSANWHTNVPNYAKLIYRDVYPGIDILFYGNSQQLEYDIYVNPEMNPNQVRLHIAGATTTKIDDNKNLQIFTNDQEQLTMKKPFAYQMDGDNRVEIPAEFVLLANNEIGLSLGKYDTHKLLVIDPVLSYSTYVGGSSTDAGNSIALDSSGNAYLTGSTSSTNFPITAGVFQTALLGSVDVFITKLNSTGTALIYSTYLGGSASDFGLGIKVDTSGNAYITGNAGSTNFPTTVGAFQTAAQAGINGFVTKLDPSGSTLVYSTYLGGNGTDQGNAIDIDSSGNAYITGSTTSNDFPTTPSAFQTAFKGVTDAFITKLNPDGSALVYSTYLGGAAFDSGASIIINSIGNAYITGTTSSTDFPVTPGAFQTVASGSSNIFITQLDALGSNLVYSTYLGGSGADQGLGITIDTDENAYITGNTTSLDFPVTPSAFQTTLKGSTDALVTKLNPTGSGLVYSTYLGGSGADSGNSIVIDTSGNAYITGNTNSTDFPVTSGAFQTTYGGGTNDVFLTKLNSLGSNLSYSTYLGGTLSDIAQELAIDSETNVYLTGSTASTDFPVTAGTFQETYGGGTADVFVTKFSINPTVTNLSPNFGSSLGGTSVEITGTNFDDVTSVTFGGISALSFIVNSDTSITATAPPGLGIVDVVVTTLTGSSSPSINSQYTYFIAPIMPPTVTNLSPNFGSSLGGTSVEITGTNFNTTISVNFGLSSALSFIVNSDTSITAIAPPGIGIVDVIVTNSQASSVPNINSQYTYVIAPIMPPTITNLSPNFGSSLGGTSVEITGTNFNTTISVSFGLSSALSFIVNSDTSITAIAPPGIGIVDVIVTNSQASSIPNINSQYTYFISPIMPPTVINLSPNFGSSLGGTSVTISGTNFIDVISVTFGEIPALRFIVNSDTSITAIAPPGIIGTVNVIVRNSAGSSLSNINSQYTYIASPPVPPLPPSDFIGVITKNKFLNTTEYVLHAKWIPSFSLDIAYYKIKKNNRTVKKISANGPFVFKIEVNKDSKTNFVIIAVSKSGQESVPVSLKVIKRHK